MIQMIYRHPVGNALRIILSPPAAATEIVLLRNQTGIFVGPTDPLSTVVYEGGTTNAVLDWSGLDNGEIYHYCLLSNVDAEWVNSPVVSASPIADETDLSVDVQSIVRERLDLGLLTAVLNGAIIHSHGQVPVLSAPPIFEDALWPVVTVQVTKDSSSARGMGENLFPDQFKPDDWSLDFSDGWLSQWSIQIVGWSLDPDERIPLRKILKRLVIGNLPVFDDAGMIQIDFSQQDVDDVNSYTAPVYKTVGTLTCLAPSLAAAVDPAIVDVEVEATITFANL